MDTLRDPRTTMSSHRTGHEAIAAFELAKGVLLLVGLGLPKLLHAEIATLFSRLIEARSLHADSRIMHALMR